MATEREIKPLFSQVEQSRGGVHEHDANSVSTRKGGGGVGSTTPVIVNPTNVYLTKWRSELDITVEEHLNADGLQLPDNVPGIRPPVVISEHRKPSERSRDVRELGCQPLDFVADVGDEISAE
jgi:hypothetical protein